MPDYTLLEGDCLESLKTLADNSIDAVVTDPPYGIRFMGKAWDGADIDALWEGQQRTHADRSGGHYGTIGSAAAAAGTYDLTPKGMRAFQDFTLAYVTECLRVLKPGGHLASFSSTRTYHRMACAIEDAGFEVRDQLAWVYGTGFPKSLDVSKAIDKAAGAERTEAIGKSARHGGGIVGNGTSYEVSPDVPMLYAPATDTARQWDGWGTALKPAWEPICLARKPLSEKTVAANVLRWGCGALNIDATRIEGETWQASGAATGGASVHDYGDGLNNSGRSPSDAKGRFPANLCHDGSNEVLDLFPSPHGAGGAGYNKDREQYAASSYQATNGKMFRVGDSGSAARFFFQANTSEEELLFCRAKAILASWNSDLANTADNSSILSREFVDSALSDVAILASQGTRKSFPILSTDATPSELRRISEALIMAILSLGNEYWRGPPLERRFQNGVLVSSVATRLLTDTTRITISRWKSDGSADAVTLDIMPPNSARGARVSVPRFMYCAKASKHDRAGSKHPTVKPVKLMQWLCRLITPPGGTILDPFAGSGTTGLAARLEGFRSILCEREAEYIADIRNRMDERDVGDGVGERAGHHLALRAARATPIMAS